MVDVSSLATAPADGDAGHLTHHGLVADVLKLIDAAGDLLVGDGADSIVRLAKGTALQHLRVNAAGTALEWAGQALLVAEPQGALVATLETTTATSFADLATVGPAVTVTIGPGGRALVIVGSQQFNNTAGASTRMSYALSGANTVVASQAGMFGGVSAGANYQLLGGRPTMVSGLSPGSTTFTAKYEVSAGTGSFTQRTIVVIPL